MSKDESARRSSTKRWIASIGRKLNYDFCPNANKYVYWLKRPSGWVVVGAGFSALVGLFVGPQGFVLMWAFLTLLVLGVVWPWLSMKKISATVSFVQPRSSENKPTRVVLEVVNRWPIPIFGLTLEGKFLQDAWCEDDKVTIGLQRMPGWSVSKFQWEITPQRRGVLPSDVPELVTGFPFGLYRSAREVTIEREVIVWPECTELDGIPVQAGRHFNIEGTMSDQPGTDGDVIGVRQYRQGDSLRQVDWAQTAKWNQLIVRERQICAETPVRIFLDLHPERHVGRESQSTYEWSVRIAASICSHLHTHHCKVSLECLGLAGNMKTKSSNRNGIKALLDFLAKLPDFDQLNTLIAESADDVRPLSQIQNSAHQSERTFFIGTALSEKISNQVASITNSRVLICPVGFSEDDLEISTTVERPPLSSSDIEILRPEKTGQELAIGWERICSHGS